MRTTMLSDARPRPRRVAVGEFDGVHLGHRAVIEGSDTVLTFEPHPRTVIAPEAAPKLLTTLAAKADLIASLGVEELVVIPFDREFASRSPRDFIDDVLVARLGAQAVSVGENFRFGRRAAGDVALLRADPRFQTRVAPLVEVEGEVVSSSHIRGLLGAGEVKRAREFLGAPFQLRGPIVSGDRRGRELGFPTANLVPDNSLVCPDHGVYACRAFADHDEQPRCAAVSIGVRPTFVTGRGLLVEAYLLDFDGDIYGRELRLDFLARLRGERRFDSADALVAQMRLDVENTRVCCRDSATVLRR